MKTLRFSNLFMAVVTILVLSNVMADAAVVTNNADSGAGSLREAIGAGGAITFDDDYTIELDSHLTISADLSIDGVGHKVTISGDNTCRVFEINSGVTASISNLTIANGKSGESFAIGGGILNK